MGGRVRAGWASGARSGPPDLVTIAPMLRRAFVPLIVAALVATACGDDDGGDDDNEPNNNELANPASVFCVEQGGQSTIVDTADGQEGLCVLPDGTEVDEWEYYREQTGNSIPPEEEGG